METDRSTTSSDDDPIAGAPSQGEGDATPDIAPMTPSLMGQLFAVPLVIVGTIVGGAVLVVFLFGAPSAHQERPMAELLDTLEASSGEKSLGLLLPREKQLWQAALELSLQLKNKGEETGLTQVELETVARRVHSLVEAGFGDLESIPTVGAQRSRQQAVRSRRLEFLILALGRTREPIAVQRLIEIIRTGREPYVQTAMHALGDLHDLPAAKGAVDPMLNLLGDAYSSETHLMACTVLSLLAADSDVRVIRALSATRLREEGEVAWSASLALARLGSDAGKSTLLDLLDRDFLSAENRYQTAEDSSQTQRYKMPPQRVEELLIAAINAASNLRDPAVWEAIEQLTSDVSPVVRTRADEAVKSRRST